jgi:23S rRNA (uracil1939-C5)-methyltransferase
MMLEIPIHGIAAGGDGIGRTAEGLAVFVPRTAPGDVVEVSLVRRKARYAKGRVVRLASPGAVRVEPQCRHYRDDGCGGCQLQHLSLAAQLEAKRRLVGDALRRIGRQDVADPPIAASRDSWRYRTKVKLAVARGRIGLRRHDNPNEVFELEDCLIVREPIQGLWAKLRDLRHRLPCELEALILREDRRERLHLVAVGGDVEWDPRPLAEALGDPNLSIWLQPVKGAARVVLGPVKGFPAMAFEQVNRFAADRIRVAAVDSLGSIEGRVVWDLYSGVGDTANMLAARGARAWSVESDRSAVEWGELHGSSRVTRIVDLVEEALTRLPVPDAVVLNPPRSGVSRVVTRWLEAWAQESEDPRVVYMSCDPATLARDLARVPSLRIDTLEAYDLFPQTAHVETLARLEAA